MENIKLENLTFSYPLTEKKILDDICLEIKQGEYIVIAGKSGCGKTTLLRHLKPALAPNGKLSGDIYFGNRKLSELSEREQTKKIGFVMQNPDNQIVTDKVWHELAFGLENLGLDSDTIRLRVAETAEYFGISEIFRKDVSALSGGQKQLLNLASVMAMNPDVLILDEPVSQLDPVAAADFLDTVNKINKELGVTVIITEHRLEEIFSMADKIAVMDNGKIVSFASPAETGKKLSAELDFASYLMPTPMKIFAQCNAQGECPVTVRDGRQWLSNTLKAVSERKIKLKSEEKNETVVEVKDVYFKYEKSGKIILDDMRMKLQKGKITAVLGGNGAGKSTLLKIIAGINKPLSGKVKHGKVKISYLPQQVQTVFTEKTVELDLKCMSENIEDAVKITEIKNILSSHPFDLSGGEMQRAALAKVLLTKPHVLLLDEPTKGMDGEYKIRFAEILKRLTESGCTVLMVSHDIEFCALYADVCMMLFDGKIVSEKNTHDFFSGNNFYTSAAYRMSAKIFDNAVTAGEVALLWQKNQRS